MKKTLLMLGAGMLLPVLLLFISLVFPFAFLLVLPVMFAVSAALTVSGKPSLSIIYGLFTAIGAFLLFSWFGAVIGVTCGISGVYIGKSILKKQNTKHTLLIASAGYGIIFLLCIVLCHAMYDINPITSLFNLMNDGISAALTQIPADTLPYAELTETLRLTIDQLLEQMKLQFPSLLFTYAVLFGYISLWAITLLLHILKCAPFIPHFSRFKCTRATVWVFLISILGIFFNETDSVLGIVFMNIYAIVRFLLLSCALSLADYWMKTKKWHGVLRTLALWALLFCSSTYFISLILNLLALLDTRLNFRKLED